MKRILCLAAAAALLLALTSCSREPTLQEIFESQYGNAYIYKDGEHLLLCYNGLTDTIGSSDADYIVKSSGECLIDNTLPYELTPVMLQFSVNEKESTSPQNPMQYGSMWLSYTLEYTEEIDAKILTWLYLNEDPRIEQNIGGEWYQCGTLDDILHSVPLSGSEASGEKLNFTCSLAFAHYNYQREIIPDELNTYGTITEEDTDLFPDKYINFPAGRYRIVQEVGYNQYVSLEFDLTYEDGMCYLHVVEDE